VVELGSCVEETCTVPQELMAAADERLLP
jgi:hypothetical protein